MFNDNELLFLEPFYCDTVFILVYICVHVFLLRNVGILEYVLQKKIVLNILGISIVWTLQYTNKDEF